MDLDCCMNEVFSCFGLKTCPISRLNRHIFKGVVGSCWLQQLVSCELTKSYTYEVKGHYSNISEKLLSLVYIPVGDSFSRVGSWCTNEK